MSTTRHSLVALLDSGVTPGHPHLDGLALRGFTLVGDREPFTTEPGFADRTGHGTACAAAMYRLNPDIELLVIRVLDDDLSTTHTSLAEAIRRAADDGATVINLSLGSMEDSSRQELAAAVAYAAAAGAVCVAAAHPGGLPLWPADLPSVISALSHRGCPLGDMYRVPGPIPRFLCHGYPRPIEGRRPTDNLFGPSLAAAHLCAQVAGILAASPGLELDALVAALDARCLATIGDEDAGPLDHGSQAR